MTLCAITAHATTYSYDTLNRLSHVGYDNGNSVDYNYDSGGNITQVAKVVNGICGSSNGATLTAPPSSNLCSSGTASGSGLWNWDCIGSGGSTASCAANIQTYAVNFNSGGNGTLTGTASQTVNYNASATQVTAVPATGYHFVSWTEGATVVATTAALTINSVTATHNYTANFAIDTFAVNFASAGNGTLTGATSQTVNYNASATQVTAAPATGYHFVNWTEGATVVATTAALTIGNVTATHNYSANFAANPIPVNGTCGSSNGSAFRVAPVTNLCSSGTASNVSSSTAWSWTCSGSNGGTNANCSAAIDITGPTLILSTLVNDAITNNATLNISGAVADVSGVAGLTINNVGVTITTGSFSTAVALQTGVNTITVIATDTVGNSTTDVRSITLDQAAPLLTITTPADNSKTAQAAATITGTTSEPSSVIVTVNNGEPQSAAMTGSTYTVPVTLASGINSIAIIATDLAGNTTNAVRTITYDNTNPSVAITTPNQDITTAQTSLIISGTVSDTITAATVTLTFNNRTYTPVITGGAFSQLLTIPAEGTYAITATATDEAGNSSSATRNVIYAIPVNASCGSSNSQTQDTIPTANLCSTGIASAVTGSGPWAWDCSGINGGTNASCQAGIQSYTVSFTSGGNGTITGTASQAVSYNGSTTAVTAVPVSGYHFVSWTEGATVVATTAALTISNVIAAHSYTANFAANPVNGICGASNNGSFTIAPTTGLCTTGTSSVITGSGPWNWTCSGSNGGSTANCAATKAAPEDTTPPTLILSILADGAITANATLNISGTASDSGSGVKSLTINGAGQTLAADGSFSAAITLVDGSNTITIVAADNAGNTRTNTRTIILDTAAPVLTITAPADNSTTTQTQTTITGTINETSTVIATVTGGTPKSAAITGSSFNVTINLASGVNTIDIVATDLAGNKTTAKRTVTSAPAALTLAITVPNQDISTTQGSFTIGGTVTDTGSSATLTITADGHTYTPSVAADGSFSQTIILAVDKTYAVVATATDLAGNSASATRNIIKLAPLSSPTIADALKVLLAINGTTPLTAAELIRYDVAPLSDTGTPSGNGTIDDADVILLLRRSIGIGSW
jgi:hypothetical protein